jgi:hypothetical protein
VFNDLNIACLSQLSNDILANGIGIHNSFTLVPTFANGKVGFETFECFNFSLFKSRSKCKHYAK